MRKHPNREYWTVTLERYSGDTRRGERTYWRYTSEQQAREFASTQLSTGAFVFAYVEHVTSILDVSWEEFLEMRGKDKSKACHEVLT